MPGLEPGIQAVRAPENHQNAKPECTGQARACRAALRNEVASIFYFYVLACIQPTDELWKEMRMESYFALLDGEPGGYGVALGKSAP